MDKQSYNGGTTMTHDELKLLTEGRIQPSPAVFEDWPLGGTRRGRLTFTIEEGERGQRVHRGSEGAKGRKTTYADQWWIVSCSDGKTRLVSHSINFGNRLTVYDHTAKTNAFHDGSVSSAYDTELYDELYAFLNAEGK